jgi:protein TonB
MWSLHAALDARSATMLGVGHFAVPPDVSVDTPDASAPPSGGATESTSPIRTIVVPHGISAVPRRSPIRTRNRTPWRPSLESDRVVERGANREWFTDRLFVESRQAHLPAACSTSAIVHVVLLMLVLSLLAARAVRADLMPRSDMDVSLRMPPIELLLPIAVAPPARPKLVERPLPARAAHPAPAPARVVETPAAAPLETPSSVEAEPTTVDDAPIVAAVAGAEAGGAADGVTGGVAGGAGSGLAVERGEPPASAGPFRAGEGIARPRKIKDVRPVYPLPAMSARIGGNVLIEATIGIDGKVHDARVLKSIALLDQAALEAVRQWEFEPSRVNGEAVPVTMVIVVTFALL